MGPGRLAIMCGPQVGRIVDWRLARIEQAVKPTESQRASFDALKAAANKAKEIIQASCPTETPLTPPARLEAMEKHLAAMLEAVKTVRPPLDAFFKSLSDEQKARFVLLGRGPGPGPGAGWQQRWRERWQRWHRPRWLDRNNQDDERENKKTDRL